MIDRLLQNNTAAKILAIFLAIMIWLYVTGGSRDAASLESSRPFARVPVVVHNLAEYHVITDMEWEVDLIVRGSSEALAEIAPDELEIFVDLSGLREGEHVVQVKSIAPPDLRLQKITPSRITVVIEEIITSQMEVIPVLIGEPLEGFLAGEVTVEPQNVLIKGSRSQHSLVDEILVIISVDGNNSDINKRYPLKVVDGQGREVEGLEIQPAEVDVYVNVHLPEAQFPIEVVFEGELPDGLEIIEVTVQPQNVFLIGPKAILEDIGTVKSLPVSLKDREVSFTYEGELEVPPGTSLKTDGNILVNVVIGTADE